MTTYLPFILAAICLGGPTLILAFAMLNQDDPFSRP